LPAWRTARWVADAVIAVAEGRDFRFERLGQATLKGITDGTFLFRAVQR
jgi:hypothetical protein